MKADIQGWAQKVASFDRDYRLLDDCYPPESRHWSDNILNDRKLRKAVDTDNLKLRQTFSESGTTTSAPFDRISTAVKRAGFFGCPMLSMNN